MTTSPTLAQKILPFLIDNQVPAEASIAILAICKNVDAGGLCRSVLMHDGHRVLKNPKVGIS